MTPLDKAYRWGGANISFNIPDEINLCGISYVD